MGGATRKGTREKRETEEFQSTLPVGGATVKTALKRSHIMISIHAPRGGSDIPRFPRSSLPALFQSTLPVGGATKPCRSIHMTMYHFNPRSPWGERPRPAAENWRQTHISIHAPRGGSDRRRRYRCQICGISIHAPRGGSDQKSTGFFGGLKEFQSTLPVGGATRASFSYNFWT